MYDFTDREGDLNWIYTATMLNTDRILKVMDVCNALGSPDIGSLLGKIAQKQDEIISRMREYTGQKDAAELDDIPGFPSTENKNHCDGCCHYAEHPFAAENSF